ncbi:MAG: amino acid transporter [Acidobacteria bacterium RIFCSPLOWO2_12_FULL_59_11]|nr:MAG: amino acid transporter [Acidobacteria bacterium RIFCSPLOWO2_12_FULL_59_11]
MADKAVAVSSVGSGELIRGLRLVDSTTLVIGSMIGSGIFIVSADVARQVSSPGLLILAWVLSTLFTLACAVSYAELAAAMPHSGGQYVYLREAFSPLFGFLFGWTYFLVIQTGTIAAVAVAFAKFLGVLAPSISSTRFLGNLGGFHFLSTQQLVAILSIAVLTLLNCFGIRMGAWIQNIFTFTKTAALLGLVLLGIFLGRNAQAIGANFGDFWRHADWRLATLTALSLAMVGPLFASDAWNNITFTGEEVENPRRNLPLALVLGVGTVSLLYLMTNFVYLGVLPLEGSPNGAGPIARGIQYAAEDRVGTAAAEVMLGSAGLGLMAVAIMISTFGCNNGLILAGARVYYAMARDKLFFSSVARVNPRYHTPIISLVVQGVWACLLTLSGTYSQLLDYIIFAVLLFYMLTMVGLFVLRSKRPEMERPYRAWGYPWVPILYLGLAGFLEVNLLLYKPGYTWPGLIIVLLGVPAYFLWNRFTSARPA